VNKKQGMKWEKRVSDILEKKFGYSVSQNMASGSIVWDKGDLTAEKDEETYTVEVKGTNKRSFRLTSDHLNKIMTDSFEKMQNPMFVILFDDKYNYKHTIFLIENIQIINPTEEKNNLKKSVNIKLDNSADETIEGKVRLTENVGYYFKGNFHSFKF